MTRVAQGPLIAGEVVNKQTGSPMGQISVTVSLVVFTDPAMTHAVTTLTTNALGVFQAYAPAGTYTFTPNSPLAAPLPDIVVLSASTATDVVALLAAAFERTDLETARAEQAEDTILKILAGGGGGGTGGGGGGNPPVVSGLTVINRGDDSYACLPFGDVTIVEDQDDSGNPLDTYTLTAAGPVILLPQADESTEVFT